MNILKKINTNKYLFYFISACIFLIIYILTYKTNLSADDYNYMYIWKTDTKISSILDIAISQYNHYFDWGGRSIAHFLVQLFLYLGKNSFNFLALLDLNVEICIAS